MSGMTDAFYKAVRERYVAQSDETVATTGSTTTSTATAGATAGPTAVATACTAAGASASASAAAASASASTSHATDTDGTLAGPRCWKCDPDAPPPSWVTTRERPAVWFQPSEVWEVAGADFTLSPVHTAGAGLVPGSSRGISVRFPRFVRVRSDKGVHDATTAAQMVELYNAQQARTGHDDTL